MSSKRVASEWMSSRSKGVMKVLFQLPGLVGDAVALVFHLLQLLDLGLKVRQVVEDLAEERNPPGRCWRMHGQRDPGSRPSLGRNQAHATRLVPARHKRIIDPPTRVGWQPRDGRTRLPRGSGDRSRFVRMQGRLDVLASGAGVGFINALWAREEVREGGARTAVPCAALRLNAWASIGNLMWYREGMGRSNEFVARYRFTTGEGLHLADMDPADTGAA